MGISLNFVGLYLTGDQRDWVEETVRLDINAIADALYARPPTIHDVVGTDEARTVILDLLEQHPDGFTLIVANKQVVSEAACLRLIIERNIPVIVLPKSLSSGDPFQEIVRWALQDHRLLYDTLNALDAEYHRESMRLAKKARNEKQEREKKALLDHVAPYFLEAMQEYGENYTAIARFLNDRNIVSPRGGNWYASTVSRFVEGNIVLIKINET